MLARIARACLLVLATLLASHALAAAEGYPDRLVRIINPYPPGGSVDIMARLLAQKLTEELGAQFIVETRAGAGGNTAAELVAKSEPDGYTLLFTAPGPLVVNQTLYTKGLPYDPVTQRGVVGKNYCYQTGAGATLFFEGKYFNPFMNAGGSNATIDDFNTNWAFDRAPLDFVGGYNVSGGFNTPLPIGYRPVPSGTPRWGSDWKRATAKWYQTAMVINASGSVMANRYN